MLTLDFFVFLDFVIFDFVFLILLKRSCGWKERLENDVFHDVKFSLSHSVK